MCTHLRKTDYFTINSWKCLIVCTSYLHISAAASLPNELRAIKDGIAITVSWTPPSPIPTGYVIYYQATDGGTDSGSVTVTGDNPGQEVIPGRSRHIYAITIVATSDHLPSTVIGPIGATSEWLHVLTSVYCVYLYLNRILTLLCVHICKACYNDVNLTLHMLCMYVCM